MTTQDQVCYTFEAAIEMAVKMEEEGFRNYLQAIRTVRHQGAKEVLKEAALDELEHKHSLEKALVEGEFEGHALQNPVPTMNLDYTLKPTNLGANAGAREALVFAIHLEKGALEFYRSMAAGCSGAPMGNLFERIANDESRHLQALEDMYEEHFLTEN